MENTEIDWFLNDSATPDNFEPSQEISQKPTGDNVNKIEPDVNNNNKFSDDVINAFEYLKNDERIGFFENKRVETADDLVTLIDENARIRYEQNLDSINDTWYKSKSPLFQEFAQVAEIVGQDKEAFYRYINASREAEDIDSLDTSNIDDAEYIVRSYLQKREKSSQIIEDDINELKEKGIISNRAERYKPLLIEDKQEEKSLIIAKEREEAATFYKIVQENENVITSYLSEKEVAGMKLKEEDKDLIYENLTYNPELQGFKLFKTIENLQRSGKFDVLSKIILLAEREDRFNELFTNTVKNNVQKDVRSIIKFGTASRGPEVQNFRPSGNKQPNKEYSPFG